MTATNTPVAATEAPKAQPQAGALKGLTTKIVTALAALGIATAVTENAEGATVILGTGLSHSTVSAPTLIQGSDTTVQSGNISGSPISNTQLVATTTMNADTAIDRITINLSALDIGAGGTLTITGTLRAGTLGGTGGVGGGGFANTQFQVQQEARLGLAGGSMTTMANLDSGLRNNDSLAGFNSTERWSDIKDFSYDMTITQPGIYYLENAMIRNSSTGNAQFENFTLNYTTVPEPSTGMLVGSLAGASLFIRRRETKDAIKK